MSQFTVRGNTDTAHAQATVPIYLVHTLEDPFCPLPGCECHIDQKEITRLLEQVNNGSLILQNAAAFAERTLGKEENDR